MAVIHVLEYHTQLIFKSSKSIIKKENKTLLGELLNVWNISKAAPAEPNSWSLNDAYKKKIQNPNKITLGVGVLKMNKATHQF